MFCNIPDATKMKSIQLHIFIFAPCILKIHWISHTNKCT